MTLEVTAMAAQSPAPTMQADLRPSADVAAIVRDPQPNVPMPIPANMMQSGAVAQSKLGTISEPKSLEEPKATERVLKPYGVAMLPETEQQAKTPQNDDLDDAAMKSIASDGSDEVPSERANEEGEKRPSSAPERSDQIGGRETEPRT